MTRRVPQSAAAVLDALRLDRDSPPALPESWPDALSFADRTFVTLHWRSRLAAGDEWNRVPGHVRSRLDRNWADNTARLRRIEALSAELDRRFVGAGVEYVRLKGLSHSRLFVADPRERVQYDLDFYCPPPSLDRARQVVLAMGYEPLSALQDFPTDHLPSMIRKTGWQWSGNYFDPDFPPAIDLHFRFWNPETEQFAAAGVEEFWARRAGNDLHPVDQVGYAALHGLRHLLRGSLRLSHLYEIAWLLDRKRQEASFWETWRELHRPGLRALEAVVFGLARAYFGCSVPEPPPDSARVWLERHAWSVAEGLFRPNKCELLLHLALVETPSGRRKVLRRRLLPFQLPAPVDAVHLPRDMRTPLVRLRAGWKYVKFVAGRVLHHVRLLAPTLWLLAVRRRGSP